MGKSILSGKGLFVHEEQARQGTPIRPGIQSGERMMKQRAEADLES
jgi:hypothetical protein